MCRNENAFCKTTTTVFAISVAFQFQVGIVLMSILCHIWKIVPDLYEAITRITHTENETSNFTHLQNCSVREPVNDVSDIYFINRNYVGVRIYQVIRMIKRSEMRPLRGGNFSDNYLPAVTTILTPF